jgi:polyphosphate glucokinase
MNVLGIDVGGSGIKGAPVDTLTGTLLAERFRVETPQPATPAAVVSAINQVVKQFQWKGLIGIGFPAVVQQGVVKTAANIDKKWIGQNLEQLVLKETGCHTYGVNDADAAGTAEFHFGAGIKKGVVFVITVGTGVGTAVFANGHLLANTELGHIELNGKDAEKQVSDAARKKEDMSWEEWAKKFSGYLNAIENLFWPDLFILGGGVCKKFDKFENLLTIRTPLVTAKLQNEAGIIGAAIHARDTHAGTV